MHLSAKYLWTVIVSVMLFACNQKTDLELLCGTWERPDVKSVSLTMTLSKDSCWAFYRNGVILDTGYFEISKQKLILKHKHAEHQHKEHHHHSDHVYTYSFTNKNRELHLEQNVKTISFIKL